MKGKIFKVTIIVPVHNSESTLPAVLRSIERQNYPIFEIFILDNNSSDYSLKVAEVFKNKSKIKTRIFRHKKDMGLSYSYNEAIGKSRSELVVTLQSDSIIKSRNGLAMLVKPFENSDDIVASCSYQTTPVKIWQAYNFWQKCLFSRHVGRKSSGRNGRFCCYKAAVLKEIGAFNVSVYRTAGEDGDLFYRLCEIGQVVDVDTMAEHLHSTNAGFRLKHYIYKENQLAEAVGACYGNNWHRVSISNYSTALLRLSLVAGLFVPKVNLVFAAIILLYSFYFTREVFASEWKNPRVLILPFVNIFLLFSYAFYFLKGLVLKKQQL